jgi:hypothetical protein
MQQGREANRPSVAVGAEIKVMEVYLLSPVASTALCLIHKKKKEIK